MRQHNGMRPHDVVVLAKILAVGKENWQFKDIAFSLQISASEVSESLNRSQFAGLIDHKKRSVNRQAFFDFLKYGFRYVFPVQPGALATGIPTAHSHEVMRNKFSGSVSYVWPDSKGSERGQIIAPLYAHQSKAAAADKQLYEILALLDVLRVGRVREIKVATDLLFKEIVT